MAGPSLPSIQDLGAMEFLSPMMFQQAQDQTGLANQFAQQNLASGAQDLQGKILANLFQQQADPMRLQGMGLDNQGKQNANALSGVNARLATGSEQEALAAKRSELLAKASDEELKALRTQAEKEYESEDPVVRARGEKKLMASVAEFNRRNKTNDAVKIAGAKSEDRMDLERLRQEAMDKRNQDSIAARAAAAAEKSKQGASNILQSVQSGKMGFEKAATAFEVMANMEQDATLAQQYADMAKRMATANISQKNAGAGNKPDLGALGIKTNQFDVGVGAAPMGIRAPVVPGQPAPYAQQQSGLAGGGANDQQNILLQEYAGARPEDKPAVEREIRRAGYQGPLPGQTQAAGQPAQQAPAAPAKPKLAELQQMYPGKSAEELRAAYKKKFGVDLQ